jgi:hypothetical protein
MATVRQGTCFTHIGDFTHARTSCGCNVTRAIAFQPGTPGPLTIAKYCSTTVDDFTRIYSCASASAPTLTFLTISYPHHSVNHAIYNRRERPGNESWYRDLD